MKIGIRLKLIVLAFLILIVPAVGGYLIYLGIYQFNEDAREYYSSGVTLQETFELVDSNFSQINDYNVFNAVVSNHLKAIEADMTIIDLAGNVLYDSTEPAAASEHKRIDVKELCDFDILYDTEHPGLHKHINSVVIDNRIIANTIIVKNMSKIGNSINSRMIFYITTTVIVLLVLIILISIRYISTAILQPLKLLRISSENISSGNLDIKVDYKAKDELGEVCLAFDRMRMELKQSLERQLQIENSRKQMLADISHDLRTPLASIKGYVEGIEDHYPDMDPERMRRYLIVLHNKADSLDSLIDDLFQFSKLELGRLPMNPQRCSAKMVLEEMFQQYKADFELDEKQLQLPETVPDVPVNIDRSRIRQVLDNIIENAKRYTGSNGIIQIKTTVCGKWLQIAISDNGSGISQKDLPHIFEQFYRCERSRSREYGGTGLGLSICRYIVQEHGGKIFAESNPGEGSTFFFTLPVIGQAD